MVPTHSSEAEGVFSSGIQDRGAGYTTHITTHATLRFISLLFSKALSVDISFSPLVWCGSRAMRDSEEKGVPRRREKLGVVC